MHHCQNEEEFPLLHMQPKSENYKLPTPILPASHESQPGEVDRPLHREILRRPHSHPWTPIPIRNYVLRPFIAVCICLSAVLVILLALSHARNGLLAIDLQKTHIVSLWHFVPTTIASIIGHVFVAIGTASLLCQPYLRLQREEGASAKESLVADHSQLFPVLAVAFRRRDWIVLIVGLSML